MSNNNGSYWKCRCECGTKKIIGGGHLKNDSIKSCGCLQKEMHDKRRLPKGVAARNAIIYYHKISAKKRNIEQALTDEQIIAIHKENCHYCGAPPSNIYHPPGANGTYIYSGIDRVDNTKGYTMDNVAPCCSTCNIMKKGLPVDIFLGTANRIYEHQYIYTYKDNNYGKLKHC